MGHRFSLNLHLIQTYFDLFSKKLFYFKFVDNRVPKNYEATHFQVDCLFLLRLLHSTRLKNTSYDSL